MCVCARQCAVSSVTALGVSHSLPPYDEIQMETFGGLPTLLTIIAPQIFYFFYFCPRLFRILSRSNGRTQTTARLRSLHLYHLGERGSFFTCHLTLPCLVLSFSHICTTCSSSDITPPAEPLTSREDRILFFCQSYPSTFHSHHTNQIKGSTEVQAFLLKGTYGRILASLHAWMWAHTHAHTH